MISFLLVTIVLFLQFIWVGPFSKSEQRERYWILIAYLSTSLYGNQLVKPLIVRLHHWSVPLLKISIGVISSNCQTDIFTWLHILTFVISPGTFFQGNIHVCETRQWNTRWLPFVHPLRPTSSIKVKNVAFEEHNITADCVGCDWKKK